MYQVVIVDDEVPQQESLTDMLQKNFPEYTIVKICSSVDEGKEYLEKNKVDLVFLDVIMPPSNGFELLKQLSNICFETIFTTSFDTFAIQAFKVAAVDYLLKPFGTEDLSAALDKFEEKYTLKNPENNIATLLKNLSAKKADEVRIALPLMTGFVMVWVKDIVRCEADDSYTTFHFINAQPLMVSRSLKECEEMLTPYDFFRTHHSHLINLKFIREYIRGEGGQVVMTDGSTVEVSRRKKEEFLSSLNRM